MPRPKVTVCVGACRQFWKTHFEVWIPCWKTDNYFWALRYETVSGITFKIRFLARNKCMEIYNGSSFINLMKPVHLIHYCCRQSFAIATRIQFRQISKYPCTCVCVPFDDVSWKITIMSTEHFNLSTLINHLDSYPLQVRFMVSLNKLS